MEDAVRHTVVRVRSDNGSTRSMAKNGGTTRAEIQSCCSGERDLYAGTFCRLANYYAAAYGDLRLANLAVPEEYEITPAAEGTANGRVDDEVGGFVEALGKARAEFQDKDVEEMGDALREMESVLSDLKAERRNLKAKIR